MRLCRFGNGRLGVVNGTMVRDVTAALELLPSYRYPLPRCDVLIEHLDALRPRVAALAETAPALPIASASLLSPIANPGKLIAAPVNYQRHLDEVRANVDLHHHNTIAVIQTAGLFLKATSSVVGAGEGIALRKLDRRCDHEVELAVVIGKRACRVARADALQYVAGYCIGLDITIRGPEERSLRKSVDSYGVLGPWLVTADEIPNPGELGLRLSVNGELRQDSNTRDLILGVAELLEYASSFYTLHPGDVIFTGTPEGVGPITPGDTIEACIDGIGTMAVAVRAADDSSVSRSPSSITVGL
jgi:2-keto-4-pentenoate hydratase/2-oxohepta-3-ene-1,7-dioic acid hydratase in catechol pathway